VSLYYSLTLTEFGQVSKSLLATKRLKIAHQEDAFAFPITKRAPLDFCFGFLLTLRISFFVSSHLLLSNHLSRNFLLQYLPLVYNPHHPLTLTHKIHSSSITKTSSLSLSLSLSPPPLSRVISNSSLFFCFLY
jgi:hypothetical protein